MADERERKEMEQFPIYEIAMSDGHAFLPM